MDILSLLADRGGKGGGGVAGVNSDEGVMRLVFFQSFYTANLLVKRVGSPIWCGNVGRAANNVDPVLSVVVHRLDIIQKDVGPVDALGHQVQRHPARLVDGVRHQGLDEGAVHVRAQDPVVVRDEHEAGLGIEGQVRGGRQVGGQH